MFVVLTLQQIVQLHNILIASSANPFDNYKIYLWKGPEGELITVRDGEWGLQWDEFDGTSGSGLWRRVDFITNTEHITKRY